MDGAVWAMIGVVAASIVSYVINPWVQARLKKQQENDPALGWQMAVREVRERAERLEKRVTSLETEVERLEDDNASKTATIARLEQIARDQSRMLIARDGRIGQLAAVMRSAKIDIPRADPALEYWLTQTPSGGLAIS